MLFASSGIKSIRWNQSWRLTSGAWRPVGEGRWTMNVGLRMDHPFQNAHWNLRCVFFRSCWNGGIGVGSILPKNGCQVDVRQQLEKALGQVWVSSDLWGLSKHGASPKSKGVAWFIFNGLVGSLEQVFPYIGNFIIPTDELIFFRGVGIPPTSGSWKNCTLLCWYAPFWTNLSGLCWGFISEDIWYPAPRELHTGW